MENMENEKENQWLYDNITVTYDGTQPKKRRLETWLPWELSLVAGFGSVDSSRRVHETARLKQKEVFERGEAKNNYEMRVVKGYEESGTDDFDYAWKQYVQSECPTPSIEQQIAQDITEQKEELAR